MAIVTLCLSGCAETSAAPSAKPALLEAADRPADTSFEDVLAEYQAYNQRLSRVAAPLQLKNAELCPSTRRNPGFSVHRLEDYPATVRPMAETLLGVKPNGLFIRSVRPNSSAEKARIKPGDQILAVNESQISLDPMMQTYNRAVLRNGFDSVLSKVRIQTPDGQDYVARIRPETACDIPAKVIYSDDINGHTDGREILITSALMQSVPDDTNLALVIAHEMGHVIAGHAGQTPSQALELEADRMALVLMARAGYDIDAAVGFWKNAAHPHDGGQAAESSHPSTEARYRNFRDELARIKAHGKNASSLNFTDIAEPIIGPNVVLTIIYDEADTPPQPEDLDILLDNVTVSSFDTSGRLTLTLSQGEHDIQIRSNKQRSAARLTFSLSEGDVIEETVVLKSEALGLLGNYEMKILGADERGLIDLSKPLSFGIFDETGLALPFDNISIIQIQKIKTGSFVKGRGGFQESRTKLVQDQFELKGLSAQITDIHKFKDLIGSLGAGEYTAEIDAYDSVGDKIYHGVVFFRYSGS